MTFDVDYLDSQTSSVYAIDLRPGDIVYNKFFVNDRVYIYELKLVVAVEKLKHLVNQYNIVTCQFGNNEIISRVCYVDRLWYRIK